MNKKNALSLISETKNSNYIIFNLNEKKYAIPLKSVIEIINLPEIEFFQSAPLGIIGMYKYNNKMINIIDLKTLLNIPVNNFSINNQIIIITNGKEIFSVLVDSVQNIDKFEENDLQTIPFEASFNIISHITTNKEEAVSIIDIDKVLKQSEINSQIPNNVDYKSLYPNDEKSKQIIAIRTNKNEPAKNLFSFPIKENTDKQFVMFTLGNQNYYLDLKYIKEFISLKRINITPLPYTEDYIKGIVNIKGDYTVVIDLKRFLRNAVNEIKSEKKLIIVKGKNFDIAFLVDDIKYIKALDNIQEYNQNLLHNSEYILAEFTEENTLYSILNFERIINDEKIFVNIA